MYDSHSPPGEGWGEGVRRRLSSRILDGEGVFFAVLLLPAVLVVLGLIGYPLYLLAAMSVRVGHSLNFLDLSGQPLGLGNFASVLGDEETWRSLAVTAEYVLLSVGPAFLIGLGLALLLNQSFPGRRWLRSLVLLPWAVPGVLVSILFLWLLDSSYGLGNALLRHVGLPGDTAWFTDEDVALYAVVVPTVWKGFPFFTLMLLAALQTIPGELYEAARMDGAASWARFRYVTWPGLRVPALLALLLNGLWVFRDFDVIFASTAGGPNGATQTLGIRAYLTAFSDHDLGQASALGLLMVVLAALLVAALHRPLQQQFF